MKRFGEGTTEKQGEQMKALKSGYFWQALGIFGIRSTFFVGVLVQAAAAHANPASPSECTLHVSKSGQDNNSGTEQKPFATLQKAANVVKAGDVVCVHAGKYAGMVINRNIAGTKTAPIIFRPYPGDHVTVDNALADSNPHAIAINDKVSYFTLEDFEITDSSTDRGATTAYCFGNDPQAKPVRAGIKFTPNDKKDINTYADHVTLQRLNIHHMRGWGIQGPFVDSQIVNNRLHDNGGWFERGWIYEAYGTYVSGDRLLIKGNTIYGNNGNGIRAANPEHPYLTLNDSIISNNMIYSNGGSFCHGGKIWDWSYGIVIWGGSGNYVFNNVVLDHGPSSKNTGIKTHIAYGAGCRNDVNFIFNNTVVNSGTGIHNSGAKNEVRNNILFSNKLLDFQVGGAVADHNLVGIDPLFVNLAARDLHLKANSPARDKGICLSKVPADFDGLSRSQGGRCDIGAYEFGASPPPVVARPSAPESFSVR
jgi:hypothetical protein